MRENKVCKEEVEMAAFLREFKKYYTWTVFLRTLIMKCAMGLWRD